MKLKSIIVAVLCICIFAAAAHAESKCGGPGKTKCGDSAKSAAKPAAPAKAPAEKSADATKAKAPAEKAPEFKLPAKLPDVAATVGKEVISGKEINEEVAKNRDQMQKQLAMMPPEKKAMACAYVQPKIDAMPKQVLDNKIFQALVDGYVAKQKITVPEEKLKEVKAKAAAEAEKRGTTLEKMMAEQGLTDEIFTTIAQMDIIQDKMTSEKNVQALVKAHPEYFNGTKVQASHILIGCDPSTATVEQKKAYDELKKINADIKAGKITFEDAAKKSSSCPSKAEGGDLGEFTAEKMAPGFSATAFALKPGEISPIIRTQFGFHIIKLIKRTDGTEKIDPAKLSPKTEKFAKGILMSQMFDKVIDLGFSELPIVINKSDSK